jgi:alanyl-tRNA synthetase
MRRAIRYGARLGLKDPFLFETADRTIELMGGFYPELKANRSTILEFAKMEEVNFRKTLDKGLKMLGGEMEKLSKRGEKAIPFETIFFMHDTHGFPPDVTRIVAGESGFQVDEEGYAKWIVDHKPRGQDGFGGSGEKAVADVYHALQGQHGDSQFLGYETLSSEAKVLAIVAGGQTATRAKAGDEVEIALDKTPFCGESGGQVGDAAWIEANGLKIEIADALKPVGGLVIHKGKVVEGAVKVGQAVAAKVDAERRQAIRNNHSATHLLHLTPREVLGDHVKQAGSKVGPDGFRFDYTHFSALTPEQLATIEERVNALVRQNLARELNVVGIEEAFQPFDAQGAQPRSRGAPL